MNESRGLWPSLLPFLISPVVSKKEMSTRDLSAQSKSQTKNKEQTERGNETERERTKALIDADEG